jgi:hypothetical protein
MSNLHHDNNLLGTVVGVRPLLDLLGTGRPKIPVSSSTASSGFFTQVLPGGICLRISILGRPFANVSRLGLTLCFGRMF